MIDFYTGSKERSIKRAYKSDKLYERYSIQYTLEECVDFEKFLKI